MSTNPASPAHDPDDETVGRTPGVEDVPAGGAGADSGAADAVQVDPADEAEIPDVSEQNDTPGVGTRRTAED